LSSWPTKISKSRSSTVDTFTTALELFSEAFQVWDDRSTLGITAG
jgi:hypothetical protein